MIGPSVGITSMRYRNALYRWDFTQQSAGALVLPSELTFARASSGHMVQDGANAVVTAGISSNDTGCIGRLSSAHGYALRLAPARTNLILNNRDQSAAGWNAGYLNTQTYNVAAGPNGDVVATRNVSLSGGYSRYAVLTLTVGLTYSASCWLRAPTGTGEFRLGLVKDASSWTYAGGPGQTVGTAWERKSLVRGIPSGGATNVFFSFDGVARVVPSAISAQSADLYSDMAQVELGREPSDPIVTTGSTATRAQERLTLNQSDARALVAGGRCGFYFKFRALAAVIGMDTTAEGWLLKSVGITPAFSAQILGNSQQLVVSDGVYQSITGTAQFSWVRGDLVEIWIELGNGKTLARWRINGGTVVQASFSGLDQSLSALNQNVTGIDLLCTSTTGVMHSFVEEARAMLPGGPPL